MVLASYSLDAIDVTPKLNLLLTTMESTQYLYFYLLASHPKGIVNWKIFPHCRIVKQKMYMFTK